MQGNYVNMDKCSGLLFITYVFIYLELLQHGFCLQSVSLNKRAQQSGTYWPYSADRAVDGNTDPSMFQGSCTHPHTDRLPSSDPDYYQPAWWSVDLEWDYDIYEVIIYNRNENTDRLTDTWVLVSNMTKPPINNDTICNEVNNTLATSLNLTVPVKCTYGSNKVFSRGRFVTLHRKSTSAVDHEIMNFCEVKVMSCPERRWGISDCSKSCSVTCVDSECAVSDGFCYKGCIDSTWDSTCDKMCFCKDNDACDRSGHCAKGCDEDFVGDHCSILLPRIGDTPVAMYDANTKSVTIEFSANGLHTDVEILIQMQREENAPWTEFFWFERSSGDRQLATKLDSGLNLETNFRVVPYVSGVKGIESAETGFITTRILPEIFETPDATFDADSITVTIVFSTSDLDADITRFQVESKSPENDRSAWTEFFWVDKASSGTRQHGTKSASELGPTTNFRVVPFLYSHRGKPSPETGFITTRAPPKGTDIGKIAGILVAALVSIILIILVIVLFFRCRKQGRTNNNKEALVASKLNAGDHTYENSVALKQENGYEIPRIEDVDELKSIEEDGQYDVIKEIPDNRITKPPPRSTAPEVLPCDDEEELTYENPLTFPSPIKVSELSSYIEERKGEVDAFKREYQSADEEELIYENPLTFPIKVSELSSYIEERKGEVDAFKREYQQLPVGDKAKWEAGNKVENRNKNKFVNIRAYDHSRVVLSIEDGDINSDYINANFITGYKDVPKVYVAAQGPKKSTLVDTWRMLWELNANRMVMITNLVENGKIKCEKYWPDTEEQYGKFKVATTSNEIFADFSVKQFKVTYKDEKRTIHHLHFTSWLDHGVPITATALLNFRKRVRSYDDIATGPMVVHCSTGVGRTGTFIALDYLLQQAKEEEEVDVFGYCCVMGSNRVNMIQTLEQYIFIYDGLLEALMSGDTSIPCPELAQRYEEMKEVDLETNKSQLQDQFDVLQVLKPAKREEKLTALEPQNKDKNRDLEIVPSNRFRPFLSIKVDSGTDYINAVYIDAYKVRLAYVLTQSPLSNTITDIWRLAYDHASRTIVMLNQLGDDYDDCPVYWPTDKDTPLVFGPLTVTLVDEKVDSVTPSITVRDFSIAHCNKPNNAVIVKQFHLTNWADGEMLPECSKDLLDVMNLVERWQQQSANGPVTIHCRNGSDKSGLYCAASYMVEKLRLDREVDVFHTVKHVRVCRPSAVPSMEQYLYLHELGLEYIDKFETYANFK